MYCTVCNHNDTKVVDSRLSNDGMSIRRRRECLKCEFRFSTIEEVELLDLTVVKRDGAREAYSRKKLEAGLKRALEKRPVTEDTFRSLLTRIERDLQKKRRKEVTTTEVGDIVMDHLKRVDKVAYIRFASVYSAFEDVKTFQEALENLMRHKRTRKR